VHHFIHFKIWSLWNKHTAFHLTRTKYFLCCGEIRKMER